MMDKKYYMGKAQEYIKEGNLYDAVQLLGDNIHTGDIFDNTDANTLLANTLLKMYKSDKSKCVGTLAIRSYTYAIPPLIFQKIDTNVPVKCLQGNEYKKAILEIDKAAKPLKIKHCEILYNDGEKILSSLSYLIYEMYPNVELHLNYFTTFLETVLHDKIENSEELIDTVIRKLK